MIMGSSEGDLYHINSIEYIIISIIIIYHIYSIITYCHYCYIYYFYYIITYIIISYGYLNDIIIS